MEEDSDPSDFAGGGETSEMLFDELSDPTTVSQAARIGHLQAMRQLLEDGHTLDATDNLGWRPLHVAAHAGFDDCLRFLLDQSDIDVNWMSFEGQTALHLACEEGHLSCIQLLLEHGANMNLRDVLQQTPLFICMRDRNVAACRALIEAGADVNCQRFGGSTPLHLAATAGSSEMVQLLLASGAELNAKEEFGITPIFAAAQFGHLSCLKLFVREAKHRGQLDFINEEVDDGACPLFLAAQEGHLECVRFLLDNGADANICTKDPKACPLLAALQFGHSEVVQCLLPHTSAECIDSCSVGVYYFSILHEDSACTELLISSGFDVNQRRRLPEVETIKPHVLDYFSNVRYSTKVTPLCLVALFESSICHAELLIQAGGSLNPRTPFEVPPLLPALNERYYDLATFYIAHGAAVNLYHPNVVGNVAIIACLHYWKGLNLLLACGAEAESFFKPAGFHPPCSFYPLSVAERLDDMEESEDDYEAEPGEELPVPVPFWRLMAQARHIMSKRRISVAQLLFRLMHFVGNVCLDPKLKSYLDSDAQWEEIALIQACPRPLAHLCRLRIRKELGSTRLLQQDPVHSLPLPQPLLDYLMYTGVLDPV